MKAENLNIFPFSHTPIQIPFGILAKRFGSLRFLGWGMMINSVFAFLVPYAATKGGVVWLCVVRFIQGLGEGPIVSKYFHE
jgi:MFS transporter, ACS family, solute carrier family 17 (sodium-dependent inorganic phosphate cotransporter), member 5